MNDQIEKSDANNKENKSFSGRLASALIVVLFNLFICAVGFYGFEIYLRRSDPFLNKLPFDSSYYEVNKPYYLSVEPPTDGRLTWGHPVVDNQLGFREREIEIPKPADSCRVMVLGDSLTWGVGLAAEERFSFVAEQVLLNRFPEQQIEILNFGLSGLSTVRELEILQQHHQSVEPDQLVVAFVLNDPQPKSQSYSREREHYYQSTGKTIRTISYVLSVLQLPQTGRLLVQSSENAAVQFGIIPPWETALQRTYETDSAEWQAFESALEEIKTISDAEDLPAPIFLVLNQVIVYDAVTDYTVINVQLPIYLQWFHQAQRTADQYGFDTYNYERELLAQIDPADIPVNELDNHPSAAVNEIYGQKLADILTERIENGLLCH